MDVAGRWAICSSKRVNWQIRNVKSHRSPVVRESAARGLGLIADPSSLGALQFAAQADAAKESTTAPALAFGQTTTTAAK